MTEPKAPEPLDPKQPAPIDNRRESARGMFWLGSATAVSRLLDVGATLVVLALLTREQMGLAAIAVGVGAIIESASGMGLGQALVQARKLSDDVVQSLFWLASGLGLALGLLHVIVAPFVAWTYDQPILLPMVMFIGLKLVFLGPSIVPHQLLSKQLRFKETAAIQTLGSLSEGGGKALFALLGFGAWALLAAGVLRGLVMFATSSWYARFRPRLHFRWSEVKSMQGFGVRVAVSGFLYQTYTNADYFLVGKILGLEVLGLYRVAFELGMQPLMIILNVINRVSYPIYAAIAEQKDALKAALLHSTRSMTLISAPIVAFLFFGAEDVLALVTHQRWGESVPALQLLVWGGMLRAAAHLFPQVYVASGKPNYAVLDSALSLVSLSSAFYLGLVLLPEWGVLSTCWAWILVYPLLLRFHILLVNNIFRLSTWEYVKNLLPALGASAAVVLAMAATVPLGLHRFGQLASVLIWAAIGALSFGLYVRFVLKVRLSELMPKK
ncbi:MAG: lipopolysaccharide biosynthesis protein [Myxococcota bacterium]|jgi:O-antigen/teichoic acid export membrane protein|nr:lipopolysaccharide biosynthesis protein [Myxococcota bacterium]